MLGKGLTVGITLFWVTMMTLLVEREILPPWRAQREAARTPNYSHLEALAEKGQTRQMGIYRGEPPAGRRIGWTFSTLRKDGAEVLMTSDTRIVLNLGRGETPLRFHFQASIIAGQLAGFHLAVFLTPADARTAADKSSVPLLRPASRFGAGRGSERGAGKPSTQPAGKPDSEPWAMVDGYPVGDALKLRIREGGAAQEMTMPFDSRRVLSDLLSPAFTPAQLRVGETWAFSAFDPLSYGVGTATARVTARERIKLDGAEDDTFVIRLTSGSYEATVWANRQGEVVKEKVLGFTLLREKPDAQ